MIEPGFYDHRIEPRDVDFTLQATLVAIADHILQAAGEDADRKGLGVRDLNLNNASWVLSRFAVEVTRRPGQDETIRIETWVSEVSRLMTTRNFRVWDAAGGQIAAAVSCWAMIDLSTRAPLNLQQMIDYRGYVRDEPSPIEKPGKIAPVANPTRTIDHMVVYSDIDFNRHANSMKYLQWMVDMLPEACHVERCCRRYTLNFLHEARYGDALQLCFEDGPASIFEVRSEEGTPLCRASLEWQG